MPRPRRDEYDTGTRRQARDWLVATLREAGGAQRAGVLQAMATAAGINTRTLRRAAADIGIEVERHGGGEELVWWWQLPWRVKPPPPQPGAPPYDPHRPPLPVAKVAAAASQARLLADDLAELVRVAAEQGVSAAWLLAVIDERVDALYALLEEQADTKP